MALSPAQKQKQYRDRQAKASFFSNDFCVTVCLKEAAAAGCEADLRAVFEEAYDELGDNGAEVVRRLAVLCYSFLSIRNAVYEQWRSQAGRLRSEFR